MIRYVFQIFGFISLFCLLAPEPSAAHDPHQSGSNVTLEEIDLGLSGEQTLKEWYENQSSNTGDGTYFGAYVTLPVGSDLYIGLASARPADNIGDGAYFASFDGENLTGIDEPDEQGFHEMIYDGSLVHIAGTDPHPDDHTAGNHYTYSPSSSTFTKYRDATDGLTNVYHTWGLWKSGPTLYAAVSAHDGTNPSECDYGVDCMGQIFSSPDNGATWTHESDLGGYRAYDIIGFNGHLYAIHNDTLGGLLSLSESTHGGDNWSVVTDLDGNVRRVHLLEFDNQLLAVSFDRSSLYAIHPNGAVTTHTLPAGYLVGSSYDEPAYTDYNVLAVAKGYLYLIAENQSSTEQAIIRTSDLSSWERMVHTSDKLISLSYWSGADWLVTATPGTNANLWRVDLSGTPTAITLRSIETRNLAPVWFTISIGGLLLIFFAIIRKFVQIRFS